MERRSFLATVVAALCPAWFRKKTTPTSLRGRVITPTRVLQALHDIHIEFSLSSQPGAQGSQLDFRMQLGNQQIASGSCQSMEDVATFAHRTLLDAPSHLYDEFSARLSGTRSDS